MSASVMPTAEYLMEIIGNTPPPQRKDAFWQFNAETMSHLMKQRDADGMLWMVSKSDEPPTLMGYRWWLKDTLKDGEVEFVTKGRPDGETQ